MRTFCTLYNFEDLNALPSRMHTEIRKNVNFECTEAILPHTGACFMVEKM